MVEGIKVKKDRDTKYYRERERERDQNLTQYSKQTKKTEVRIKQRERDEKWWKFMPRPFVAKISEGEIL